MVKCVTFKMIFIIANLTIYMPVILTDGSSAFKAGVIRVRRMVSWIDRCHRMVMGRRTKAKECVEGLILLKKDR